MVDTDEVLDIHVSLKPGGGGPDNHANLFLAIFAKYSGAYDNLDDNGDCLDVTECTFIYNNIAIHESIKENLNRKSKRIHNIFMTLTRLMMISKLKMVIKENKNNEKDKQHKQD